MAHPSSLAARRLGALASIQKSSGEIALLLGIPPPDPVRKTHEPEQREAWTLQALAAFMERAESSLASVTSGPEVSDPSDGERRVGRKARAKA